MIVAFGFYDADADMMAGLMEWIGVLGSNKSHTAILVCDETTQWSKVLQIKALAESTFGSVEVVPAPHTEGWIAGSVAIFRKAAERCREIGQPWLFMEPDAVPLSKGWLESIESEYTQCKMPFMGGFVTSTSQIAAGTHLEGVSVYPANALSLLEPVWDDSKSWVVFGRDVMLPNAHNAHTIQQLWGDRRDNPPIFSEKRDPARPHVFTLDFLRKGAVLFHRTKTPDLIRLLRQKLFPQVVVVLPFCQNDFKLMLLNLQFLEWLHGTKDATAVCHFDSLMPMTEATPIIIQAKKVFREVHISKYPKPPVAGWPWAPNVAFNAAAKYMASRLQKPWFWYEADGVAVKPDWLERMSAEYYEMGQLFMGCHIEGIVPKIGHLQGTAIYPPDAYTRMPKAMKATGTAFDTEMASETVPFMHATKLIQHNRGQPEFKSKEDVRKHLSPEAVYYHADKSLTLLNYL